MSRFMKDTMRVSRKVLVKVWALLAKVIRYLLKCRKVLVLLGPRLDEPCPQGIKWRAMRKVLVRRKDADISSGIGLHVPRKTQSMEDEYPNCHQNP
ncbi:hypothetical protein Tco_1273975 [Tanacetum coccineum]